MCSHKVLCLGGPITTESVWVYHTKRMGHICITTYYSTSHRPQQQDERVEREEYI
jgi:putative AlgH/UPF0301 family transcriptional regulator